MNSEILDRLPPHNSEAELSLVGSMVIDPAVIDDVSGIVRPDQFYDEATGRVFGCLVLMHNSGQAIDPGLLVAWLKEAGEFDRIGGTEHLAKCIRSTHVAAHAEYYARIVAEAAKRRALIHVGLGMARDAYLDQTPADDSITAAEAALAKAGEAGATDPVEASVAIGEALTRAREIRSGHAHGGLCIGLNSFDCESGGLFPAELVIMAGRPSSGKTSMAMQAATWIAEHHEQPVLFVSLEMTRMELAGRMLAVKAGVNSNRLRTGSLTDMDIASMERAAGEFTDLPMAIDDSASQTAVGIRRMARRMQRKSGLSLVVVDYLTMITPADRKPPRDQQIGEIAKGLKAIAKDLHVPVLCLAQFNREAAKGKPRLHHLGESGQIEQHTDMALAIWRPEQESPNDTDLHSKAWLLVMKSRNGPVAEYPLTWDARSTTFSEDETERFTEFD